MRLLTGLGLGLFGCYITRGQRERERLGGDRNLQLLVKDLRAVITLTFCRRSLADSAEPGSGGAQGLLVLETVFYRCSNPRDELPACPGSGARCSFMSAHPDCVALCP